MRNQCLLESLDYAGCNQLSLVLKKFGWLEKEFKADRVRIKWVYSEEGGPALQHLLEHRTDFASFSGFTALLGRAKGHPVKSVYMFSRPESSMILVCRDSFVISVRDLKGEKIAAAPGTNPYFFHLSALRNAGLQKGDVDIIPLDHENGRVALVKQKVDARAAVDPYCAYEAKLYPTPFV